MRILLVEDEITAAALLQKGLREQGYAVDIAADGEEGSYKAFVNQYDLIILDVVLPKKDGFTLCQELRAAGATMPILMLTARDGLEDRIEGLENGADDYLTKPFEYRELLARVRALLRRGRTPLFEQITVADLTIDVKRRTVHRAGRLIELSGKEYAMLEYMARRAGEVVTREDLSEHVWDESFDPFTNSIEVYILRLRRKVDSGSAVKLLRTRRGEGYTLTDQAHTDV